MNLTSNHYHRPQEIARKLAKLNRYERRKLASNCVPSIFPTPSFTSFSAKIDYFLDRSEVSQEDTVNSSNLTRHDYDSANSTSSASFECHQQDDLHHINHQHHHNMTAINGGNIIQYATQAQDTSFLMPVTVSGADLQAYQLRAACHNPTGISQVLVSPQPNTIPTSPINQSNEDAAKKRELRLIKNREAAKECRRKKKEYIKCLEQRVAVLEDQNKALIEELKALKTLYCQKE